MTSEYDLSCATCGGPLTQRSVAPDRLGVEASESLSVAECAECAARYFPERTLERL